MASTHQVAGYKWLKPLRIMRVRWRLSVVGLFAFVMRPDDLDLISRVLIGWDAGVALYLALAIWAAIGTDTKHIRLRCVLYDEGRVAIPLLSVTAASASLGAIFFQLSTAPAGPPLHKSHLCRSDDPAVMELHSIHLRLSYAPEFYADHRGKERGLAFPNDEAPWLRVMIGLGEEAIDAKSRESRNDVTWAWNGGGRFSPAERSHGFRPNRDRHLPDT
jgi:uncharacterized membrane protein